MAGSQIAQAHQAELAVPSQPTYLGHSILTPQYVGFSTKVYLGLPGGQRQFANPVSRKSALSQVFFFPPACGPDLFSRLPAEMILAIMEHLHGEDILILRRAVPQVLRVLETGEHSSEVWKIVRLAAGLPVEEVKEVKKVKKKHERPTASEMVKIRYVLETHCMACGDCHAYRQWNFGFRLCSTCLIPRLTMFPDFMAEHGEMFTEWGQLREAIPWHTACSVPGLAGLGATLVTRKTWADQVARELKISISGESRKQLRKDKENINSSILASLEASHGFTTFKSLVSLSPAGITTGLALNRLARQRQKWFTERLLSMAAMKFTTADIPKIQDPEWRKIMSKRSEPGREDEWEERQTRLRLMARAHRNKRLTALLHDHTPPLPYAGHADFQRTNHETSHHAVGSLPAFVFLKICRFSDAKTAMALERTCSAACSILRSSAAETTWHHLRLAAGLEAKYAGWSERRFLNFALRKLCHCGSEGVTLWTFAMTLCGDCFAEHVLKADEVPSDVIRSLKRAMPSLHPEVYAARGWISSTADSVRLLSRDYVGAIQHWISHIPAATQAQLPPDFLSEYLEEWTAEFREVVQLCEKWQEKYCSRTRGVRRRREIAITRKIQIHFPEFNGSARADDDLRWKRLVDQPHPLSEREWRSIRNEALKRVGYQEGKATVGRAHQEVP